MAEKTCGDCIHAEICEKSVVLPAFYKDNPAYCRGFKDAADFEPVRRGRWVEAVRWIRTDGHKKSLRWMRCSNCGFRSKPKFAKNYCPNCGAKMEQENP